MVSHTRWLIRARIGVVPTRSGLPASDIGERRATLKVTVEDDGSLAAALRSEHGWWFKLVLDEFDFLVDRFGYMVAGAYPHFRGSMLVHVGNRYAIGHYYSPDERRLDSFISLPRRDIADESVPVWRILQQRDPGGDWRAPDPSRPLTRRVVRAVTGRWARGLEMLAGDVLQGADIPGQVLGSDE
jgi:hypothetical protein